MTAILGISAYYHDSAAALVVDGRIVAAAQEERFTRKKHDAAFPKYAIEYCLREAGISPADLSHVGYYEKPLRKLDRLIENYLATVPQSYRSFRQAIPTWLKDKVHVERELRQHLPGYRERIVYCSHHQSHAASAFFPSPFYEAAIVTIDGVGEWTTAAIGKGQGNQLQLLEELRYPHSLGLLYSAFTAYCGFKINSGEYKLMGLAPYGSPVYRDAILNHLIDLKDDGSLRMDMRYFHFDRGLTMTNARFHELFGGPPRRAEDEMQQRYMDVAASIQSVTEEAMLKMARHARSLTNSTNLVMAGGVALNCVGNGRLLRESGFERIWIQPAAGDAGGSLGIALLIWYQLRGNARATSERDLQDSSLLGPQYDDAEIETVLKKHGAQYIKLENDEELCRRVAEWIDQGNVVGWFQGRMEFGPRALGARSILADARRPDMQSQLNRKIKFRESFRPFAAMVLADQAHELFDWPADQSSPYMLMVTQARQGALSLPAVTHVDNSTRLQTVSPNDNPLVHRLLVEFFERTGCGAMINTSFNMRGQPIVCSPEEAYRCFMSTDMDGLAIGHYVLWKKEQPALQADWIQRPMAD